MTKDEIEVGQVTAVRKGKKGGKALPQSCTFAVRLERSEGVVLRAIDISGVVSAAGCLSATQAKVLGKYLIQAADDYESYR